MVAQIKHLLPQVLCNPEMLQYVRELMQLPFDVGGGLQCVSYDTQFNVRLTIIRLVCFIIKIFLNCLLQCGDFYVSTLTVRDVRLRSHTSEALPILPVFAVSNISLCMLSCRLALNILPQFIHERKLQAHHNWAFEIMVKELPELATTKFVAISDGEFTAILSRSLTMLTFTSTFSRFFKKAFVALDEVHICKDIKR